MVKNFTNLSAVKLEVGVSEVTECNAANKEQQPCVVSLPLGFKRIVAQLVAIGLIMNVMFLLKSVAV